MTKVPPWAANLTQRLLAEAPESMAFWEIMANAIAGERARAIEACRKQSEIFGSTEYATGQPLSSFQERFACDRCIAAIEAGE